MSNVATLQRLGFRPLPADEYDTYLRHVLALLASGATDREVKAYLEKVERDYLGLSSPAGDKVRFLGVLREAGEAGEG